MELAIAQVANRQHGQIARWQLRELGVTRKVVARLIKRGVLIPSFPGAFSVGHRPTTQLAWASAAVLACGRHAVLSHNSAAVLWDMLPRWQRPFHVTASRHRDIEGSKVHRNALANQDITLVDAYFPDDKLVVELDGYEFHKNRTSFESDRDRDADLLAIDHATIRITDDRLTNHAHREAERLGAILRQRRPRS